MIDIYKVIYGNEKIIPSAEEMIEVNYSFEFLKKYSKDRIIYGINTGLGPMAQYHVQEQDFKKLQLNLIRSHSCGCGDLLTDIQIRAILLSRYNSLIRGFSGVHPDVILLLSNLINLEIYPLIFEHGGVGASGDLIQLAHIALVMIGEGHVRYRGVIYRTMEIFEKMQLKPIDIHIREGLGLINGTSAMTGIAIINIFNSKKIINIAVLFASAINEIVESFDDHYSVGLNSVKSHCGQNAIAEAMRNILESSGLIKQRKDYNFDLHLESSKFNKKVQEYYSLRCIPQILGPIFDTILNAEKIVIEEFNSVNDNPIIDWKNEEILHGGNFHGDYISFEMDKLKIAITKLTMLSERQINYLLNDRLNEILPPFLNEGTLGVNLGLQGLQFTATSTTAENQTLSNPMYIHSIPTNKDNQDIVSMGTNSALLTAKVIENAFQVLSVESVVIFKAIDILKIRTKLSVKTREFYDRMKFIIDQKDLDEPLYEKLTIIKKYLQEQQ